MSPITRIWVAFAALGAAMIYLAVGASAPIPVALVLVAFGLTGLVWGVAVLVRGRLVTPNLVLVVALLPLLFWGIVATLGSGVGLPALPLFPMAVASLFSLFVAAALAVIRRRMHTHSVTDAALVSPQHGWRFLVGLALAGVVFSGLTTPALAATDTGSQAVPHGTHSIPGLDLPGGGHHH